MNRKKTHVQLGRRASAIRVTHARQLWTTRRCGGADRAPALPAASAELIAAAATRLLLVATVNLSRADLLSMNRHKQQESSRSKGVWAAAGSRPRSPAAAVVFLPRMGCGPGGRAASKSSSQLERTAERGAAAGSGAVEAGICPDGICPDGPALRPDFQAALAEGMNEGQRCCHGAILARRNGRSRRCGRSSAADAWISPARAPLRPDCLAAPAGGRGRFR